MSFLDAAIATPAPLGRWWRASVRVLVSITLMLWCLLLLAWLALHWVILPHVDTWRSRIEDLASRSVGAPVRIGRIDVRSSGWVPALELRDVVIEDARITAGPAREALRLPHVTAALSVPSLLALELRFDQLLIENAELDIRRDAQGRIRVAGLDFSAGARSADTEVADWFFEQHEFAIRAATLRWIDELRQAPPLVLTNVQLVVRNGVRRHDLRLDATPPLQSGDRFSFRARLQQPLLARAGDWRQWSGTVYADLPRADATQLKPYLPLPFEWHQGTGAARAWIGVGGGQVRSVVADVALNDVALRLAPTLQTLNLERLSGRLRAEREPTQLKLSAENFSFDANGGLHWPAGRMQLSLNQSSADEPGVMPWPTAVSSGELNADRLELAVMAAIAERLPLGSALSKLLTSLAPRGSVRELSANWDGPLDAPRHYQARAQLKGISIAAAESAQVAAAGRPGLQNADIDLQLSELGGEARVAMVGGGVELPGVLAPALVVLDRLDSQLAWRVTPARAGQGRPQIELQVKQARFENSDAQVELSANWHTGNGSGKADSGWLPGVLDLNGKLSRGKAASVARYLPLAIPKPVRDYVQHALLAGEVSTATFKLKGDLEKLPFDSKATGEFLVAGHVQNATFAYVPSMPAEAAGAGFDSPWPVFTQAQADLVFDRLAMSIRNASARIWAVELRDVHGGVRDLIDMPTLEIEGLGRGPAADMLRFVNATPVGEWTGKALARADAARSADLKLALSLPLTRLAQSTVKGSVTLAGNDVRLSPDAPPLTNARGRIDFSHKGFALVGANARVLGGDVSFEGGTKPDGSIRFDGQGVVTAEGLRSAAELPPLPRLGQVLQGQAAYRLQLGYRAGQTPEVTLTSTLQGMAIDLPAPLTKPANGSMNFRYQVAPAADGASRSASIRDDLRIELGGVIQTHFVRESDGARRDVLRGAIAVNAALPPAVPGVQAVAEFSSVNVDAWAAALKRLGPLGGGGDESGYVPNSVALKAQELVAGARRVTHLVLGANRQQAGGLTTWRANADADQLSGYIEYRQPRSERGAGRVYARLARLTLPPADADSVTSLLDAAPDRVPALDVVVDDFELRGKKLGHLELEAVNRGSLNSGGTGESARDWHMTKLTLRVPEATLSATGQWGSAAGTARKRMVMEFKLELADGGALLERLGFGKVVRNGKGNLQGQVAWLGSPLMLDIPSLEGQLNLGLDAGQFLKTDPGAARLLGVLSLQSLPRRLLLDFRDVFQDGFAFDNVSGDVQIHQGVASTNNLRLRGLQAAVLMEGQADIARETQDLRVLVVPDINAGTASLAYAVINPAIGLGSFVAQLLLRRPLMAASTREFHVSGGWSDPQVDRIERKPVGAGPGIDMPAAAASSPTRVP